MRTESTLIRSKWGWWNFLTIGQLAYMTGLDRDFVNDHASALKPLASTNNAVGSNFAWPSPDIIALVALLQVALLNHGRADHVHFETPP